jgi:hypothetical protein
VVSDMGADDDAIQTRKQTIPKGLVSETPRSHELTALVSFYQLGAAKNALAKRKRFHPWVARGFWSTGRMSAGALRPKSSALPESRPDRPVARHTV